MGLWLSLFAMREVSVFDQNITHNLNTMAKEAGIYEVLWRPEEVGIEYATQLIDPLKEAISKMEKDPEFFRKFDSPNGWGTYNDFLPWLKKLLEACEENPDAKIESST